LQKTKISKRLGNNKPSTLLDVEFKLWQALLAVATGTKTAISAVTDFLDADVPWDELESISDEDRDFFLAGIDFLLTIKFVTGCFSKIRTCLV